jgi:hypothetical protein
MTSQLAEYTGTLLHKAEARTAMLDHDGHAVPVLCLDIELDNTLHTHMRVEQPFPSGHHAQAHAAAHRLVKGTRVTVQVPLIGLRLVASNTSHIHTHTHPTPEASCPA